MTPPDRTITTYEPVRRSALTDLVHDPRFPIWRLRAIIAAVAGILVGLWLGWPFGVTAAVLAAIADTVWRAQITSSIPAWRKVSAAERRTERQLERMGRAGYRALHARAIPGSDAQIDHLVVGPTGVYAVDSEKWDKRLPVRAMSHRKLFHGPFNQKPRLDEARWEAQQASELIGAALRHPVDVTPSLAIYGPKIPWNVLTIRDVDVYTGARLRRYLRRRPKTLDEREIDMIYATAEEVLPPKY